MQWQMPNAEWQIRIANIDRNTRADDTSPIVTQPFGEFSRSENDWRLHALQMVNRLYARVYHRVTVKRPCRLPRKGPAILVCNHTSGLDPSIVQATSSRLIRWMMAREYYDLPAMRWIFDAVGPILVDRNGRDMAATRTALQALESGYVVGVFPEGKIETSRELLPFHAGVALLAAKSGAAVYPTYLDGTQRKQEMLRSCLTSNNCTINFGDRIDFSDLNRSDLRGRTERIRNAILNLAT